MLRDIHRSVDETILSRAERDPEFMREMFREMQEEYADCCAHFGGALKAQEALQEQIDCLKDKMGRTIDEFIDGISPDRRQRIVKRRQALESAVEIACPRCGLPRCSLNMFAGCAVEGCPDISAEFAPAKLPSGVNMKPFRIRYTNWRGETSERSIIPIRVFWDSTEWHPEEQWLMEAFDTEKRAMRIFAMKDMMSL